MPRHQLLSRLGRSFHVVWIDWPSHWRIYWLSNNAAFRAARPGEFAERLSFLQAGALVAGGVQAEMVAYDRTPRAAALAARSSGARLQQHWPLLVAPGVRHYLDLVTHDFRCYHVDDEYSFSSVDRPNDSREVELIKRVDQVIVHSQALFEKKGGINTHFGCVPNGVDYESFATPRPEPADLARVSAPADRLCRSHQRELDVPLMYSLAKKHPEMQFVFVGPLIRSVTRCRAGRDPEAR